MTFSIFLPGYFICALERAALGQLEVPVKLSPGLHPAKAGRHLALKKAKPLRRRSGMTTATAALANDAPDQRT